MKALFTLALLNLMIVSNVSAKEVHTDCPMMAESNLRKNTKENLSKQAKEEEAKKQDSLRQ